MPARYSFVSSWHVPIPAPRAWEELTRLIVAPQLEWWPAVTVPEPARAVEPGEGLVLAVRSPVGYRLRIRLIIDEVERGHRIAVTSTGDLHGSGRLEVTPDGEQGAAVAFHWVVDTQRRWMNATAWLLRPVFERAHTRVMAAGERGLRAELARRCA